MSILLLSLLLGMLAGLRSLTPPAIIAWAIYLGWLTLEYPLSLMGSAVSVGIWSALALAELIADKTPNIPNRTSLPGLVARVITGGLAGACLAAGLGQSAATGAALGAAGAIAGCFGGFQVRVRSVKALRVPDLVIALAEDTVCILGSVAIVAWATA